MSEILRYTEHDTVTINFGNIIFSNDKQMPFIENCFIPLDNWEMVKLFIDTKIKENEQDKNARHVIGG